MIAVTGATGKIGAEVVRLLTTRAVPVRVLVRDPNRARAMLGDAPQLVPGDLREEAALERLLAGAHRLFLVSSAPALEGAVVDAAARAGVEHVVKSSAIGFGVEPPAGHRAVEQRIEASGVTWTHLRPSAFMQTLVDYLPGLIDVQGEFALPAGEGRTAWVDTRDIAAVGAAVLTQDGHGGRVYPVTGAAALSMHEVARDVSNAVGRPVRYVAVEEHQAFARMARANIPEAFAAFLVQHYTAVRDGGFAHVSTSVQDVTGTAPRTFGQYATEHAAAFTTTGR